MRIRVSCLRSQHGLTCVETHVTWRWVCAYGAARLAEALVAESLAALRASAAHEWLPDWHE
jgi:hypothetical protein